MANRYAQHLSVMFVGMVLTAFNHPKLTLRCPSFESQLPDFQVIGR